MSFFHGSFGRAVAAGLALEGNRYLRTISSVQCNDVLNYEDCVWYVYVGMQLRDGSGAVLPSGARVEVSVDDV